MTEPKHNPAAQDADPQASAVPASSLWRSWGPLLFVLLPLAAVDVAIVPLMSAITPQQTEALFVYCCFGFILSQGGLLSTLLVCGNGSFWKRLLLHWLCAIMLTLAWAVGFWLSLDASFSRLLTTLDREAATIVGAFPAASLGLQLPLWLARCYLGWRLDHRMATTLAPPVALTRQRFSIYDLMLATAIVAVTLAVTRLAPWPAIGDPLELWSYIAMGAGACLGLSLVAVLPLVWFFTLPAHLLIRWLITLGYTLIIGAMSLIVPASGVMGLGTVTPFLVLAYFLVIFSYALAMCLGLSLLESAGLRWNKNLG